MKSTFFKLLLITPLLLFSCKNRVTQEQEMEAKGREETEANMEAKLLFNPAELPEEPLFNIETNLGTIQIKLYKETPLHRDNFVKLASERFFDGILFHRVIQGFMIQTGDPLTKDMANVNSFGTGGPGYTIEAEILETLKHKKGAVAAARRADSVNPERASSGSQFYIVEDERSCAQLDGGYTVFGETIEGFEVIDAIAATTTDGRDRPVEDVVIKSIKPAI